MHITVTDPKGFEVGFQTGVFQSAEHCVLIDSAHVYGAENILSHFRDRSGKVDQQEWAMFVSLLMTLTMGQYKALSWKRE